MFHSIGRVRADVCRLFGGEDRPPTPFYSISYRSESAINSTAPTTTKSATAIIAIPSPS